MIWLLYIAVIGGSSCSAAEKKIAFEVGSEIARNGAVLVCGGGSGVMEAAAEGATSAGGTAIGVLPGEWTREGNRYLSFAIATGLGEARNAIITRTADAVIAVGGEYGTLSEIALALKMGKPTIGINSWTLQPPHQLKSGLIHAGSPVEAVEKALSLSV